MDNIEFSITGDGTTGLYNSAVGDVYHSVFGAKTEALEKFIRPLFLRKNFSERKQIRVLDICYGIGYNTKALLSEIINLNIDLKVSIDILETDKMLVLLSPFIKDGFNLPVVSNVLLKNLKNLYETEFMNVILSEQNYKFFSPLIRPVLKKYQNTCYGNNPSNYISGFLHNIYYQNISNSNKIYSKYAKDAYFKITPYIDDARKSVGALSPCYDIIFLDAFTPKKLPTLWTVDFFKRLYYLMSSSGILLTYSNSAAVRHAFCDAGFYTGKLYDRHRRHCGTVASKNQDLIQTPLGEFDLGLMQTGAGVYYKDVNLDADASEIIADWECRKKMQGLQSTSSYLKQYKNKREATCMTL